MEQVESTERKEERIDPEKGILIYYPDIGMIRGNISYMFLKCMGKKENLQLIILKQ